MGQKRLFVILCAAIKKEMKKGITETVPVIILELMVNSRELVGNYNIVSG